jgi:hypothetical protein
LGIVPPIVADPRRSMLPVCSEQEVREVDAERAPRMNGRLPGTGAQEEPRVVAELRWLPSKIAADLRRAARHQREGGTP